MSQWLVVDGPEGDPERIHVVPADVDGEPDPTHEPSRDCACHPEVKGKRDLAGRWCDIVVHRGSN